MSAATKKTPPPSISVGPCVYMAAVGEPPFPALVTKAGSVISLIVFPSEGRVGIPKETIRHASDPENPKYAHLNLGYWDYTDDQKALKALTVSCASTAK